MVECAMQPISADLCDPPETEYLDGRPQPKMSPRLSHGLVQTAMARVLADCAGKRGIVVCEVRFAPGAHGGSKTELVPDVAFVDHDRLAGLRGEDLEKPPFSPDIAIEIRSPSDDGSYVTRKITRYLATGSALVLDVDPQQRCIEAHTHDGLRLFPTGEEFSVPHLPWLRFDVARLFAELR